MDFAELQRRLARLAEAGQPQEAIQLYEAEPIGRTSEGEVLYRTATGMGLGYTERGRFTPREHFESEDAACQHVWRARVRESLDSPPVPDWLLADEYAVRLTCAAGAECPDDLATDPDLYVRDAVALNPAASDAARITAVLGANTGSAVQLCLGVGTPSAVLRALAERHPDDWVRNAAEKALAER